MPSDVQSAMEDDEEFDLYGDGLIAGAAPDLGVLPAEEVTEDQHERMPEPGPSKITVQRDEHVPNVVQGHDVVYLAELHWWTSDEDIKQVAASAGFQLDYGDISFGEVKQNGKSRGLAYVNCRGPENAARLRNWFENNEFQNKMVQATTASSAQGNPYKPFARDQKQGAVSGIPTGPRAARGGYDRGGFAPRGRGQTRGAMRGGMPMNMNMGMMNPMMMAQQQGTMGMMGMNMGMGMGMGQTGYGQAAFNPAFFGAAGNGYQDDTDAARKRPRTD